MYYNNRTQPTATERARTILADSVMVNFLNDIDAEILEQIQYHLDRIEDLSDGPRACLSMDEGAYMAATENSQEIRWSNGEIADLLATAKDAFRRNAVSYFGHKAYFQVISTPAAKAL